MEYVQKEFTGKFLELARPQLEAFSREQFQTKSYLFEVVIEWSRHPETVGLFLEHDWVLPQISEALKLPKTAKIGADVVLGTFEII